MTTSDPPRILPAAETFTLANGLKIGVIPNRHAPVVSSALWYRAGTRDEAPEHVGTAHFLEHMMFKGAERFGPGEIDRVTRALGGSNNAFTGHDATAYYFTFAADRWQRALEIEVDRMTALALEPHEVDSERQVILEEIAMYEGEPWDALEIAVLAEFYGRNSYGRPVLGTRESLARIDGGVLRHFHQRCYRPANAVLSVVGDVDPASVARQAEDVFARVESGHPIVAPSEADGRPTALKRLVRHQGEVPRLLAALAAPAGDDADHPLLRLLLTVLASGRSSRLHRRLVDEGQLCVWVSADLGEQINPGAAILAAELVPGVEPQDVEDILLEELEDLGRRPPTATEVERAKHVYFADWVFGHETVEQQALLLGAALSLFDADHPWRHLHQLRTAGLETVQDAARRLFGPGRLFGPNMRGVIGWSLPQRAHDV